MVTIEMHKNHGIKFILGNLWTGIQPKMWKKYMFFVYMRWCCTSSRYRHALPLQWDQSFLMNGCLGTSDAPAHQRWSVVNPWAGWFKSGSSSGQFPQRAPAGNVWAAHVRKHVFCVTTVFLRERFAMSCTTLGWTPVTPLSTTSKDRFCLRWS